MEENIPKDPLSELFRKNLRDEELEHTEPSVDEWDLPSDNVWAGLSNNLPSPPPSTPILKTLSTPLTWAAVLVVGVGIAYCIFSYQQKLATLTKQVEALQAQQEQVVEAAPAEQEATPEVAEDWTTTTPSDKTTPKENQQEEFNLSPPSLPPLKQENDQEQGDRNITSVEQSSTPTSKIEKQQNQATAAQELRTNDPSNPLPPRPPMERKQESNLVTAPNQSATNTSSSVDPNAVVNEESVVTNDAVGAKEENPTTSQTAANQVDASTSTPMMGDLAMLPTPSLASLAPVTEQAVFQTPNTTTTSIIPKLRSSAQGFYVGAMVAPTSAFIQVKGNSPGPGTFKRDKILVDATWGLEAGYHLNRRWSVSVGGQYSKLTSQSQHLVALKYSRQRERPGPNQRFESDYEVAIPTAYGEVNTEISLYREVGTMVADDVNVPIKVQTTQQLELLTLPLMVQYRFMDGPLRITAQGGFAGSFVLDNSTEILAANVDRRGLAHQKSRVIKRDRPLRAQNLEYLLGMGLEWQVAPKWQISVEPVFSQTIRPIFDNRQWKSSLVKSALTFGIQYQI